MREDHIIKKLAAYVILGITADGVKEVIAMQIGENESSKYWLGVMNDLKNRGIEDILVICADGLIGIKEAITTVFPKAEYKRCIVHMIRNALKHVSYKDKKNFANDLKGIYQAPTEKIAHEDMLAVSEKWDKKYPNAMKRWEDNWDSISSISKFSQDVRKIIYTTNAIESLNSTYKKLNDKEVYFLMIQHY